MKPVLLNATGVAAVVAHAVTISRLVRLKARAHRLWICRHDRLLAWQREHGIVEALRSLEWMALAHKLRRSEERMSRLGYALRAAGWKPLPRPAGWKPGRKR